MVIHYDILIFIFTLKHQSSMSGKNKLYRINKIQLELKLRPTCRYLSFCQVIQSWWWGLSMKRKLMVKNSTNFNKTNNLSPQTTEHK